MADVKISGLPASTTPLAGTEVLPVVQGGVTKQVSVSNLTAGRAVSAASLALTGSALPVGSGGTGTATAFTAGSVIFAGTSGVYSQDNANLFWDDANNLLGVGTATPDGIVTIPAANSNTPRLRFQHPTNDADASIDTYRDGGGTYLTIGTNAYLSSAGSNTKFDSGKAAGMAFFDNSGLILFYNATAAGGFVEQLRIGTDGNVNVKTGNLVIGTSGKGIDFSVTPDGSGTMTSELLADYEEGTWTPVDTSGANLTFTVTGAAYRKVGSIVFVNLAITYPATADANFARVGGLPFTSTNTGNVSYLTGRCGYTAGGRVVGQVQQNQTRFNLFDDAENLISNANMSGKILFFSGCYIAA